MDVLALRELARRYVLAQEKADKSAVIAKADAREASEIEQELWDALEESQMPTFVADELLGTGTKVQLQRRETRRARILDPEVAEAALEEMGLAEEVLDRAHKVRQQRLNQEINERLQNGDDLPAGIDYTSTRYITVSHK